MWVLYLGRMEFGDVVFFLWRKENRRTRRKNLAGRRQPTTNSNHTWHRVGIEPGLNWWRANAFSAPLNYTEPQKPRKRSQAKNISSDWLGQDVRVQQIKHRVHSDKRLLLVPPQTTYLTVNRGQPLVRTVNFEESIK